MQPGKVKGFIDKISAGQFGQLYVHLVSNDRKQEVCAVVDNFPLLEFEGELRMARTRPHISLFKVENCKFAAKAYMELVKNNAIQ